MKYNEIKGDLIKLALDGKFDVITHGCNCFCTMSAGIAPQMVKAFNVNKFSMESKDQVGNINKLGCIDYEVKTLTGGKSEFDFFEFDLTIINSYTQYGFGRNHSNGIEQPLDYEALTLCLRKINHLFKGKHIGLPKIGCGLAGGSWSIVSKIIRDELRECDVTIVIYNK